MTSIGLTDTDVIAIFHQNLCQCKGKAVDAIHVALDEQHAAGLIRDRHAVWQFWRGTKAVQDRLFVVVPRDALELFEDLRPLVSALIVDAVELFV